MDRREFMLGCAGLALPAMGFMPMSLAAVPAGRRLLLVELQGGNDGLNMVVPFTDPEYYRIRPRLAVARDQVLPLSDKLGFNPAMEALAKAFGQGDLAVVLGLGYPGANQSHFRSIQIWNSASRSDQHSNTGWLSRLPEAARYSGAQRIADAIVLGRNPGPVEGGGVQVLSLSSLERFARDARPVQLDLPPSASEALRKVVAVQQQIGVSAEAAALYDRPAMAGDFPGSTLGRDFALAARLLAGAPAATVVKIAQPGYDTHKFQRGPQDQQLQQLAQGLTAFRQVMKQAGVWDQTLVLTYSEFGRRPAENGSQGTDHGTASAHLVMGGKVRGGLYGEQPSLTDLDAGNLRYTVDFRRYYDTVLHGWWSAPGVPGGPGGTLGFL